MAMARVTRTCPVMSMLRGALLAAALLPSCATFPGPPVPRGVLADRQRAAMKRGDWLDAVQLGRARVAAGPLDIAARYDLACALARAGDDDAALATLRQAVALGYDDVQWLSRDDDLGALRRRPEFAEVLAAAQVITSDGIVVDGTRVLVRGALRLRLPLTPATSERPGLVLWLHPRGARLNPEVERLAPAMLARGWALAVPIAPRLDGWNDAELTELLDHQLPALDDVVNVQRVVLLGFSAGAQAALVAWATSPSRYTAIIAIGPPADLGGHAQPASGAPVHLVFGALEPARQQWPQLLTGWRTTGLDVSETVVPGRGHELLVDDVALLQRLLPSL
jgi:predicted esterase